MNFEDFQKGSKDHRPLAFWSLNHELTREELSWQIAEMADKGLQGFILHARSGLLTPYLSEAWFDMLEHAVREAERHGLKAWLYDEDPYPSGIAGGKVITEHPEYRAQTLAVRKGEIRGPGRFTMDIPLKKTVIAVGVRVEGDRIVETVDLTGHMGILRTTWMETKAYHTYYPTTDSKAMPQFRSDTEGPFLRLDWDAPDGDWRVFAFFASHYGKFWLFDSFTDLLNPDAVEYFMETTYRPYEQRFRPWFGGTIPGIFIDEPKFISSPYPWTDRMAGEFRDRKGYGIEEALVALELDTVGAATKRRDFWQVVGDLFDEAYTSRIGAWCKRNGLQLIGHNSPEEEPADQVVITGDLMRFMKGLDVPGTDLITYMIGDRRHPIVNLGPKLVSSISRQWKDGRALCEAFGVMEWRLDLADMAWIANWLFSLGVNVIAPHTFIYSIDGSRKKDAAPSEFYQAPYWPHFRRFADHVAALGYLLGDAEPYADTALVYPFDSFQSLSTRNAAEREAYRDRFVYVFDTLIRAHIPFELVDIDDLLSADVADGCLSVGKRRYRNVILPPLTIVSGKLEEKVENLLDDGVFVTVEAGDRLVYRAVLDGYPASNDLPWTRRAGCCYRISGSAATGLQADGIDSMLARCAGPYRISGEGAEDVFLNCARKDGREVCCLFNSVDRQADVTLAWPGAAGRGLELWVPGAAQPVPLERNADGAWVVSIPPRGVVCAVEAESGTDRRQAVQTPCRRRVVLTMEGNAVWPQRPAAEPVDAGGRRRQ